MSEAAYTYFVYEPGFDEGARTDLVRALYDVPGLEPAAPIEEPLEQRELLGATGVSFCHGSFCSAARVDPDRHLPGQVQDLPCVDVSLRDTQFMPSKIGEQRVDAIVGDYVDFVARFYERCVDAGYAPTYVLGADTMQVEALMGNLDFTVDVSEAGLRHGTFEQVFWLQILPPETVEDVGRELLLSTPAERVEELEDGAVFLVAYDRPYPPGDPTELADYLGVAGRRYVI